MNHAMRTELLIHCTEHALQTWLRKAWCRKAVVFKLFRPWTP